MSDKKAGIKPPGLKQRLAVLSDQILEAPDLKALSQLLTQNLPEMLGVSGVTFLLWNRKLDTFEGLSPGETQIRALQPNGDRSPEARYLIADNLLLETPTGTGDATLVPLMARSGLIGMLVLDGRRGRRKQPYRPDEVRWLTLLAKRAALTAENQLYLRELIASERLSALGTMAGMLAHDFRGPMTIIRGYAETLQEGNLKPADVRGRAETIVRMVDRLERMTTETLDFARGGARLARRTHRVARLLDELASDVERSVTGLEVVRDLGAAPETSISVDLDKLRRAVLNIAANAREAMGGKGRFHIAARVEAGNGVDPGRLVLTLADEGPGVPEAVRERLFEPFVTHGKKGGTGLGLAVARRFIEDHGGAIELLPAQRPRDPAEPAGARFRVSLPMPAGSRETAPGSPTGTV